MLVQRKRNQKKRHFFLGIFSLKAKNHNKFPKFFPRLQKFLTETPCYTGEKERKNNNVYRIHIKIRTMLRFTIDAGKIDNLEVIQVDR